MASLAMLVNGSAMASQNVEPPRAWRDGGILVTEGDISNCPYNVVSKIEANVHTTTIFGKRPSDDKIIREMRERSKGADAIVRAIISPLHSTVVWGKVVTGQGSAIRFKAPCPDAQIVP